MGILSEMDMMNRDAEDGVLPPHFGQKKSRRPFSDFLLGVPLYGRRVFSCESSGQIDPMCGW